jgi:hypothetical protein
MSTGAPFMIVAPCARRIRSIRIAAGAFHAYDPATVSNGWRHPCSFGLFFYWRHCCRRRAFRPAPRMRISSIRHLPPPSARPRRFQRRLIRRSSRTAPAPTASRVAVRTFDTPGRRSRLGDSSRASETFGHAAGARPSRLSPSDAIRQRTVADDQNRASPKAPWGLAIDARSLAARLGGGCADAQVS